MSLVGFDFLRDRHRDQLDAVERLEQVVERAVTKDIAARLDEYWLSTRTNLPIDVIELFLVELCASGVLEPRAFWNCPNGDGVTDERRSVSDFPEQKECGCGNIHFRDPADLEIGFIPSDRLVAYLKQVR
jgi:hypothetical protein